MLFVWLCDEICPTQFELCYPRSPASSGESDTGQLRQQIACGSRYTPFAVASCASKVHRASGSGRATIPRLYACAPLNDPRNSVRDRAILSLSNAVVSVKSPFYFSGSRSTEAFGIALRPPRSLYIVREQSRTQSYTHTHTDTPTIVTLAAHARRGLTMHLGIKLLWVNCVMVSCPQLVKQ